MLTLVFFIILAITVEITNKKNNTKGTDEILEFEKGDSLIILICVILSVLIDLIAKNFLKDFYIIIFFTSCLCFTATLIIVNNHREALIKKKHDQIVKAFDALADIFGRVKHEEIDFLNIPFILEEDPKTGNISQITIDTSIPGGKFNDNTITLAQYSINKYFPEFQWTSLVDYPKREVIFKGLPKPPKIANYPGSDYRPTGLIPLGVSGQGEVCWNIADPKDVGISSYLTEEGDTIETVNMPSAPQCLTLGSTGGGKSIWIEQIVQIKKNNK